VIRLADLHDVHAGTRLPPTSKSTPRPTPGPGKGAKIPGTHWHSRFCTSPGPATPASCESIVCHAGNRNREIH
jgi:hypothetical protein